LSHEQATDLVEAFTRFTVQPVTVEIVRAALNLRGRHSLSYWDAAIIEAARTLRCTEILSEDLSADENYDGLRVINPFTTTD
jgi:predicted nucleic acid-binding protein